MMGKMKGFMKMFGVFALGFGAIIGVGWSVTLNNLMILGGGPLPTALGFGLSIFLVIPIALCFAELTSSMPVAGGVMAYAYKAYGSGASFAGGWLVIMAYLSILPWEAIAVNDVLAFVFPFVRQGPVLYCFLGEPIYLRSIITGVVLSFLIIVLNWRGVSFAASFQSALTLALILCSAMCIASALGKFDVSHLLPAYAPMVSKDHQSFAGGVLALIAAAPFYFCGFDTIPQGAEDLGKSFKSKNLGRIIVLAVLSAGLFYVLVVFAAGSAYPWLEFIKLDRPALSNLLRTVYSGAAGNVLFWISIAGTLAGLFSTWNGFFIAGARLLLGMGRARFLPETFVKVHKEYKTPIGGNIFCSAIMIVGPFLGIGVIDKLMLLGSTAFVAGWLLACMSAITLRAKHPDMERPYKMRGGTRMAVAGCVSSIFMVANCILPFMPGYMGTDGVIILAAWMLLGLALYAGNKKHRCSVTEQERERLLFER